MVRLAGTPRSLSFAHTYKQARPRGESNDMGSSGDHKKHKKHKKKHIREEEAEAEENGGEDASVGGGGGSDLCSDAKQHRKRKVSCARVGA